MTKKIALAITHLMALLAFGSGSLRAWSAAYTGTDVGPSKNGELITVATGYDIRSRSRDIGGTADDFSFGYEKRTGNFDVQAQLEGVTITDAFVHAGLMARGTLDTNAPFAAVFSSSALLGSFFETRSSAGAAAQTVAPTPGFPVNYPQMFLRLRRIGNAFTGYASLDGKAWRQLGSASLSLPNEVFFGIALSSLNTNALATARFRDIKEVASPQTASSPTAENPGPSNRRTGLVFSEIMYNPGPRSQSDDLEFIEIFSAESIFLDLTGWRITGGVQFDFPPGFRIEPGQFVVIAADPGAVQRAYGLTGVLGPYQGHLNNSGESLKLLNRTGATRLEVKYGRGAPWPIAADGMGHSLVLSRPSYGEDDPRAWSASEKIGGSPGEVDARWPNPWRGVVLNEILAEGGAAQSSFVELYNANNNSVDLSSCLITDDMARPGYALPSGTILPARGFLTVNQSELNFSLRSAQRILLVSTNSDRVLDAVEASGPDAGISFGRVPDGAPRIARLAIPTPNQANAARRLEEVVINELMYNPITGQEDDTYIELHNRSGVLVDLSGWKLADGVDFDFPEGSKLEAGGFLVVAKNAAHLRSVYPQLNLNNTLGDFSGNLSGSGERVTLAKRLFLTVTNAQSLLVTNLLYATVSEISYSDGGHWPELADGGGSSLELIDPRADTTLSGSWAASDEASKAQWTTVEVTGKVEMGSGGYPANRVQVLMLGAGECLLDDIEVIPAGSTNLVVNGDFESANSTWRFFGNHSKSKIEQAAAGAGGSGLHLIAPGDGDTANNTVRGTLSRNLPTSGITTIRAKARWVAGWPEVLLRIRGNWLELPARLQVPKNLGTPGQPNSRRVPNGPPAIYEVSHSPALPRANEAVVVTCRISDPDGIASPRLQYRLDPEQTLTTLPMLDDGSGGDVLAGDGIYSATITGKASRTLLAYRIVAGDDAREPATSVFPAEAPARECLIKWDDPVPFGTFVHYHMWSTSATEAARSANPDLDNTFRDATLVYGNGRIVYNAGFRDKGSPYHNGSGDFAVTVPRDEPLLGVDDRIFASTGNGGDEGTFIKGDMAGWVAEKLGIPFLHSHFMRLYRNGSAFRSMMYDMEQPNRYFAKSWLGGGGVKDDLFKISIWFEFDDNNSGFNSTGATLQRFISDGQYKLARYRWNWQLRPSTETANDYSSIFNLAAAANGTTERTRVLPLLADMEEWMRVFGYHRVTGNWDSYSYNVGQNMYLYAPLGLRAALIPWDIDFVLGEGDAASAATLFTASTDSVMQQLFNLPAYRRMLWRTYQDAINGPLVVTNFQPQIDARRTALTKNGVGGASPTSITSYMNGRRNYLAGQLQRSDANTFYITSNSGEDFSSSTSSVLLTGVAPFAIASIEVNGVPFPINWTSVTNWQITVPLNTQTNLLQITGRDLRGQLVAGAADNITVQFSGVPPQPNDWVMINEINYHGTAPDSEFVELFNRHPSFAFDLSGFRLEGVDFTFPSGTLIQPNGYLVIVKNRAAFAAAFGPSIPVVGPYGGRLQFEGETLRLIKPGANADSTFVIDEVRYSNATPWPLGTDGFGPSIQLIDPAQDNSRAGNWSATSPNDANRATPGRQNAGVATLEPFPNLWINEVQPFSAIGAADHTGQPEPWIELYNRENSSVDLSGLFLSDDPGQLAKWQFPSGTSIPSNGFLLVWADGETAQSIESAPHANFRLTPTNGFVLLSRMQGATPAVVDYVRYQVTAPGNTYGSYPDGDARHRRMFSVPTPGAANNAAIPDVKITINEWMAASQAILRDPADGQFQDWFELYNAGTNTVDLGGYYLTDNQGDPAQFQIPAGYKIGPSEHRLIWADGEPQQNAPARDLHVNFSLRADGEEIALFTPDEQLVTAVNFGQQIANVSEGRYPDGAETASVLFAAPTPGAANVPQFANRRPTITAIPSQTIAEGQTLAFTVVASDADIPAQALSFALVGPPSGAKVDAQTGEFSWTPDETHGPGVYTVTVRVTDNGIPPLNSTVNFVVAVREVNEAPAISSMADVTIDEGSPFSFTIPASDPDIPAQILTFSLESIPPSGVVLDPKTGEFRWTPTEAQGPGTYTFSALVADNGQPPLTARRAFNITVRDVNNPPIFEDIPIQSVSEGNLFTLQVRATDPETPPAPLTYSLNEPPAGMTIDPETGLISWLPGEADGPRDYNIKVVVSEPGGVPSTSAAFLLGVREINLPPSLDPIASVTAQPGDVIAIQPRATDVDIPVQNLNFKAIGALPPGASLATTTGAFSWQVPQDPPVGTNRITIEVADEGTPALTARQSFDIIVRAPLRVAINEIMHRPATPNAEYIELLNYSAVTPVDLSGWRLEGYDFTFPAGTSLAPGGFLCVARSATAFRAAYGGNGTVLGDALISVGSAGGLVRLIKPGGPGFPDETIDELRFSLDAPWPAAAASQGASLQMIDPWKDHRRVLNWAASASSTTNTATEVIPLSATWKYWQNATFPGSTWMQPAFADSAWPSGGALLFVEGDALPAPKVTPLTLGQISYYFRTHFNFSGNVEGATLRLDTVLDDGAVFYLNGQESFRLGMPAGAVAPTTLSSRTVGNAANEGPFDLPGTGLRTGDNVFAVEVHQVSTGSSDIVLGVALQVVTLRSISFTPNAPNSVGTSLETVPPIWINELVPNNLSGLKDNHGEFEPWLELYNASPAPVILNGWGLTDDPGNLGRWTFPDGTAIPAGGFLLVWLDGQSGQSAPGQLHAGFRLPARNGMIVLAAQSNGRAAVVDYVTYGAVPADQGIGLRPDGNPLSRAALSASSPGASNSRNTSENGPALTVALGLDKTLTLTWTSEAGRPYRIETSSAATLPQWTALTNGTGDGSVVNFSEPVDASHSRFYRLVLP